MRVDDRNLTHGAASQTGKTAAPQDIDRAADSRSSGIRGVGGGDEVELSGLVARLSRAISAASTDRTARIEELSNRYEQGRYQVDSLALGRAILSELRAAGHERPERGPAAL
jgi:anti-sigma28 factor (negative regulator of flagellin synthesis)